MTEDLAIESQDPISQQVIGTSTSFLWIPSEDEKTVEERNYEQKEFTDIMLNFSSPEVSDFYQVWEQAYSDEIENFRVSDDRMATVTKFDWLVKVPSVLTMQINRLSYCRETGKASKSLHNVPIDKVIYPDRFTMKNRNSVRKIREFVKGKRENIAVLKNCLKQYTSFNGSETGIDKVLGLAHEFCEKQGSTNYEATKGINTHYPLQ